MSKKICAKISLCLALLLYMNGTVLSSLGRQKSTKLKKIAANKQRRERTYLDDIVVVEGLEGFVVIVDRDGSDHFDQETGIALRLFDHLVCRQLVQVVFIRHRRKAYVSTRARRH